MSFMLRTEAEESKGQYLMDQIRIKEVSKYFPRLFRGVYNNSNGQSIRLSAFDWKAVRDAYQVLATDLTLRNQNVAVRTTAERQWIKIFESSMRSQFLTSVWIGRYNIDIFAPGIAGDRFGGSGQRRGLGLAIEVNGPIHDRMDKGIKDHAKENFLHSLGVMVLTVQNNHSEIQTFVNDLKMHRMTTLVDSRSRTRMWRRIWLVTLAVNSPNEIESILRRGIRSCNEIRKSRGGLNISDDRSRTSGSHHEG